jgi:hypothetical protein
MSSMQLPETTVVVTVKLNPKFAVPTVIGLNA